jgi:hypothetical protein
LVVVSIRGEDGQNKGRESANVGRAMVRKRNIFEIERRIRKRGSDATRTHNTSSPTEESSRLVGVVMC